MFRGNSTREQLDLIISKLGTPTPEVLRGNASRAVIESIRRQEHRNATPWEGAWRRERKVATMV